MTNTHGLRRPLFWMVLAALALRLAVMLFVYRQNLDPATDHWSFGFEEGRVARSMATGQGFGNPLYAPTGPTAWFGPVYPAILAGVFKIFGVYTPTACIAILVFNDLVSALTCIPIFFFTRRGFGEGVAQLAAWLWVSFPDAIYGPNSRIWDTWLTTLLLAILFCMALSLAETNRTRKWVACGLLSGAAALTNPSLLSVLPLLALWALWRLHRQGRSWILPAASCVLATILVIAPWVARNYRVFHKFIPIGDSFGLEIGIGNNGDSSYLYSVADGPWNPWQNNTQWREFQRLGEVSYFALKGREGLTYIENHPGWYAWMVARRIVNVWTDYWSVSPSYLAKCPYTLVNVPLYTLLSGLTLLGLWRAFQERRSEAAVPYAIVCFFFPLVYYVTHTGDWYRRPIDPFFVALASNGVAFLFARLRRRRLPNSALQSEAALHLS